MQEFIHGLASPDAPYFDEAAEFGTQLHVKNHLFAPSTQVGQRNNSRPS
jgi:hypothetical protein